MPGRQRVFGPSLGTRRQAQASRALHRTLDVITRPDGTWLDGSQLVERVPDLTVVASALRQGTLMSHQLGTTHHGMPDAHREAGGSLPRPRLSLATAGTSKR